MMGLSLFLFAAPEIIFSALSRAAPSETTSGDQQTVFLCLREKAENDGGSSGKNETVHDQDCEPGQGVAGPLVVFSIAQILLGIGSESSLAILLWFFLDKIPKLI